jgi:acyl carrier protein
MRPDTPIPPVGYPVEGIEILIVDEAGREAPAGEIGELWVKGRYMSPGYWRRPDLTERAFARDRDNPDLRIYRTGDLGMIRPDGKLQLAGRADSQVKLGGQRVELSEIETALRALTGVSQAAVVARQTADGPAVHAYIVPVKGTRLQIATLRRQMAERLPAYMLPARIALLDAMPLNSNGKVDRKALAPIGDERPAIETPYAAPRTSVEAEVAAIWQEVMSLDAVGINDRFLELGGQSIQATRIAARILDAFRVDLPASYLFNTPTVAEMATLIVQQQAAHINPDDIERLLAALETAGGNDD